MPRKKLLAYSLGLTLVVLAAYGNHFQNGFHFDDYNTINANTWVHDLRNVPRFFVDPSTFSTLPDHQMYRPITSLSLAIDYWLAGGLKPFYFHLSTFLWFALLLVLMVFLFRRLMDQADAHPSNPWVALAAVACYGLHPATAETVNYINQRADLFCALGTLASLLWFIAWPAQRRRGWYLLPAAAGSLAKPPVLVFPFLLAYVFLFEQSGTFALSEWKQNRGKWMAAFRATIPAVLVTVASVILAWLIMPQRTLRTLELGAPSAAGYRMTQPWVVLHYFKSFFLPTELSADADWGYVSGPFSMEALIGYAFVLGLLAVAIRASRKPETRPAAFGIVWFFLALMPTSLLPLAEVTNDHRMFFPFVGLSLAVFWSLRLVLFRKTSRLARARSWQLCAIAGVVLVLGAAAAGTHERNKVWRTDESLWRDVVAKSPRNGRGLMNYGLIFMQRGDYASALSYFNRALAYTPNYWAVETNLGIANGAIGRAGDAEMHFVRALTLGPEVADAHFFYARWLDSVGRADEAAGRLEKAVQLNPRSLEWRHVLIALYTKLGNSDGRARIAKEALQLAPGDEIAKQALTQSAGRTVQPAVAAVAASADGAEELLKASNEFYRAGQYEESIAAAKQALELRPEYAEAYNNIAAANNALHRWNEGIWAAMQAVRIKPDYQLARYNLAWGMTQKTRAKVK